MHPAHATPAPVPKGFDSTTVRVERFGANDLPLIEGFSRRYWSRPTSAAFYRWRYLDSHPFSETVLAIGGDRCLGTLSAFRKDYRIAGRRTPCLEVFDWHCLPGLRGSGIGIRLMRAMMRAGDRLISVGGTVDVTSALPAMGWQRIGTAVNFELPLTAAYVQPGVRRRLRGLPGDRFLSGAVVSALKPRRRAQPPGGTVAVGSTFDLRLETLYDAFPPYELYQLPSPPLLTWVTTGASGRFAFLTFDVGGSPGGWAFVRVYDTPRGRESAILDVYARQPSVDLYTWFVSEAALALAADHPAVIRARATCPLLQAALRRNHFRAAAEIPIHSWPHNLPVGCRLHMTLNHADGPVRPYANGPDADRPERV